MRKHYDKQRRFDCTPISELVLNFECRDEIIPVLTGLQYIYTTSSLRNRLVDLVAQDINEEARSSTSGTAKPSRRRSTGTR